ncbi:MAG: hypothetical protein HFJ26_09185 [Clostridia bacterium]|nr:hypothetical protein [Clostridia bacterium]
MKENVKENYNVFLVQLKPFGPDKRNNENVVALQEDSINEKICGMGWGFAEFFQKNQEIQLQEIGVKNYKTSYKKYHEASKMLTEALNRYNEIEEGDYILTRLYNTSLCYIGKVKSKAYHSENKLSNIRYGTNYSWIVDVEWKNIGPFISIPSALRGVMQSRMNTIKKLDDIKHFVQKKLIKALFGDSQEKIEITSGDFYRALDALDLEDLVAKYIIENNSGYMLIPSSCKSNEQTFEFKFLNKNKIITCQVKNNEDIDCNVYSNLANNFEKIYLFSGKGYIGQVKEDIKNIILIEKKELFDVLKKDFHDEGEFYNELHQYYIIKE